MKKLLAMRLLAAVHTAALLINLAAVDIASKKNEK